MSAATPTMTAERSGEDWHNAVVTAYRLSRPSTVEAVARAVGEAETVMDGRRASQMAGRSGPWADVVGPDELVEQRDPAEWHPSQALGARHRRTRLATRAILLRTDRL